MENQTSTIDLTEPSREMTLECVLGHGSKQIVIPPRPKYSPAEARALLDRVQQMFAGEPSLEDEYFGDREREKW